MRLVKKFEKELALEIIVFCVGIVFIYLFYRTGKPIFAALLVVTWLLRIIFWRKKREVYFY